jgi:predicted ester cyclase
MATQLTTEQMKQRGRDHFEDFVNRRKAEVIRANMTPDFYDHDGPGGKPTNLQGDEEMMLGMYEVMPDLHLTIEEMIAAGDKVVCRNIWRWTAEHSGKQMQFHGFVMWVSKGKRSPSAGPPLLPLQKEPHGQRRVDKTTHGVWL